MTTYLYVGSRFGNKKKEMVERRCDHTSFDTIVSCYKLLHSGTMCYEMCMQHILGIHVLLHIKDAELEL